MILDTNVVSELVKASPEPKVTAWADRFADGELFITAVTKAEILYGLEMMPQGRRHTDLHKAYRTLFETIFFNRVLPFDNDCVHAFGRFAAIASKRGGSIGQADMQIASICSANYGKLATRNVDDFDFLDIEIINPWTD